MDETLFMDDIIYKWMKCDCQWSNLSDKKFNVGELHGAWMKFITPVIGHMDKFQWKKFC